MYNFPANLYTDVRIEKVYITDLVKKQGQWAKMQEKEYNAAFIRMYDGKRWFYTSISSVEAIQAEIEKLALSLSANTTIEQHPQIEILEVNQSEKMIYASNNIVNVPFAEKIKLVDEYEKLLDAESEIKKKVVMYEDFYKVKEFYSSKGASLKFDNQIAGISLRYGFGEGDKVYNEFVERAFPEFEKLRTIETEIAGEINKGKNFFREARPVKPGFYTAILSPEVTGVFAHESFGHKSEADFMLNDESMKQEWQIGREVGSNILSIIDDGNLPGSGYTPFDDEGSLARKTYLIKNGLLNDRLHSSETASILAENLSGNCRALNYEYEPIVRMTSTYIEAGNQSKDDLFATVNEGVFIETISHGSGMSRFTMKPSRSYLIQNGKITEPVNIAVVSGNVMETLHNIDGLSDEIKICSFLKGGCGKMEQYPLPVSFGGPFIRVRDLDIH